MKRHMRRVIGLKIMSHEEFLTIINQIEAILNSRPLVALSNDMNDAVALTPAHFLIGGPKLAAPQAESEDAKKWKRDYLTVSYSQKLVFKCSRVSNWRPGTIS